MILLVAGAVALLLVLVAVAAVVWLVAGGTGGSGPRIEPDRPLPEPAERPLDQGVARLLAATDGAAPQQRDPDEFYEQALRIVVEIGAAAPLVLQRRLGMTFEQVSGLIERMAVEGFIKRSDDGHWKIETALYDYVDGTASSDHVN